MTELIWDGKYDENGRKTAPLRVSLPFQTVETVNESAQERQRTLDLWGSGRDTEWRNRLIWGDKKYVLPSLLDEFAGKVDLIYIDPPFDTGADFSFHVDVDEESFVKTPSVIEIKAYRDTWGVSPDERSRGKTHADKYLGWLYDGLVLLADLLSNQGSIYVHLDWHKVHLVKAMLDEILGADRFVNEIVWKRSDAHNDAAQGARFYGRIHDSILFYTRGEQYTWNTKYLDLPTSTADKWYRNVEEGTGRLYNKADLTARKAGGNTRYEWKGVTPPAGRYWAYSYERMQQMDADGKLVYTKSGMPYMKRYLDESRGVSLQDWWDDIPMLRGISGSERTGYATQKPEALLKRIIEVSSGPGDLILDCFVGSGTTAVVAEKLGRRWIACDLGRFAIHTTRKRLLDIPDVRPFVVQNLGKYERQLWQAAEFGEQAEAKQAAYRKLILDLYHATPVNGYAWLHGVKGGRMVHVGAVDSPVSVGDVTSIAGEFRRAVGTGEGAPKTNGVDVLGWDFAFEMNEVAKQKAAEAGISMRFLKIPHDVMDKRARDQGDIRFFELAALSVEVAVGGRGPSTGSGRTDDGGRTVTLTLTDFVIPPDEVPEDVQRAITKWEQWIDYWAVDWDNKGDTFHNQWQDYRTRKKRELQKSVSHEYEEAGEYVVVVKVIDILGNDTTKTLTVRVG